MQQSNFIFAMLALAFIVYITVKGELSTYITLLRGGGNSGASGSNGSSSSLGGLGSTINGLLSESNSLTLPGGTGVDTNLDVGSIVSPFHPDADSSGFFNDFGL